MVHINQYLARLQWSSSRDQSWGSELKYRLGMILGKALRGLSKGYFHSSLLQAHPLAPFESWPWPEAVKPPARGQGVTVRVLTLGKVNVGLPCYPFSWTNWWRWSRTQRRVLVTLWGKYDVIHWKGKYEWIWKMAWMCLWISSESSRINTREETVLCLLLSIFSLIKAYSFKYVPTSKLKCI